LYQFVSYSSRNSHTVVGRDPNNKQLIAELSWDEDTGEVRGTFIHPDYVSEDLETTLWEEARQYARDEGVIFPQK
jgi:GNAT superfamily N-acetyltransferase